MNFRKTIKNIAKYFNTFIIDSTNSFANIILILVFRPSRTNNLNFHLNKSTIAILANGPSLREDFQSIQKNPSSFIDTDFMVLNSFACSDIYEIIEPKFYIFFDFALFDDNFNDINIIKLRKELVYNIVNRTGWDMIILIPNYGNKSNFVKELRTSKFITINLFSNVPLNKTFKFVNHFLYNHNLGNMSFRNTLICAIFQSLRMNYSRIYIFGADHSWHEDLKLSETNELLRKESYFYQKEMDVASQEYDLPVSQYEYEKFNHFNSNESVKVHQIFYYISQVFSEYHVLQEYSDYKGIKIINLSSKSWIDAFPKKD